MDSEGRKVVVCDNGTGVSQTHYYLACVYHQHFFMCENITVVMRHL